MTAHMSPLVVPVAGDTPDASQDASEGAVTSAIVRDLSGCRHCTGADRLPGASSRITAALQTGRQKMNLGLIKKLRRSRCAIDTAFFHRRITPCGGGTGDRLRE